MMIGMTAVGKALFFVEPMPDGSLALVSPNGCIRIWDERDEDDIGRDRSVATVGRSYEGQVPGDLQKHGDVLQ